MVQVTVEKEAIDKAVKTKPILKICPFSPYVSSMMMEVVCRGERCQIWDVKRGNCQIENLGEILLYVGGGA